LQPSLCRTPAATEENRGPVALKAPESWKISNVYNWNAASVEDVTNTITVDNVEITVPFRLLKDGTARPKCGDLLQSDNTIATCSSATDL